MKRFQNPFMTSSSSSLSRHFYLLFSSSSSSAAAASSDIPTLIINTTTTESNSKPNKSITLTETELTKINLLIPRLCCSNNLPEAIRLTSTALVTNPPLKSLSLSILIDSLSSQHDMTQSMSFLNRLKHNPNFSNPNPILGPVTKMLISSYLKKKKAKEALKVLNWMCRPDSTCLPDGVVFGVLVSGLCRLGLVYESLNVLMAMVGAGFRVESELRLGVYRGLLKEARVREAKELNDALSLVDVDGAESLNKVARILDVMIANWTE